MKKFKIVMTLLIVIGLASGLLAREPEGYVPGPMAKASINQTTRTMSNISNWGYWMYASGKSAGQPNGSSGGIYPRGTAGSIYLDGLVWGCKYNGDANDLRVGGVTYNVGTVAGWINADGTAASPSDERVKIWRIRSDWQTLTYNDVKKDAMELNELSSLDEVTDAMCQAVIDQYQEDWENWPADLGAPTYSDGTPGIADADQIVWYVTNDLNESATHGLAGSDPIGIELQVTAWAYNQTDSRLGQVIFKKYRFINKSGVDLDDMYVSQWCDPDLGYYGNDYVGCDTTLSLGYAYNGTEVDDDYAAFGLAPAAVGYDFFQGPMVDGIAGQDLNKNGVDDAEDYAVFDLKKVGPGKINLPMSSFGWFAAGSAISDPTLQEYEGTLQWYNLMSGFKPIGDLSDQSPWTLGNITGNPTTKYPLAGDPVTRSGYIDGKDGYFEPGDRRMCLTAGPFNFPANQTQEVVVAVIGGLGGDRLSSVSSLKGTDFVAQQIYDNVFASIPKPPSAPNVSVSQFESKVILSWADPVYYEATEGPQTLSYEFEGYNVYQLPSASASLDQAKKIATYDVINGVTKIKDVKLVSGIGEATITVQDGVDSGIQRYFTIEQDYITGKPLYEGKTYYFAVTAYNADENLPVDKALESSLTPITVVPQELAPGNDVAYEDGATETSTHTTGSAGGSVNVSVVDPMATTGHDYSVYFDQQTYYRDADLMWKPLSANGKSLSKTKDVSDCDMEGSAVYSSVLGKVDIILKMTYGSSTGAWIDGVELVLPEGVTPISATITDGAFSNYTSYGQVDLSTLATIDGNKVSWGDSLRSTIGAIEGNMYFKLVMNSADVAVPFDIKYSIWDDNYAAPLADDLGTLTLSEIGYEYTTVNHWNLLDETTNKVVLADQSLVSGAFERRVTNGALLEAGDAGIETTVVDGVELSVNVSYGAPSDYTSVAQHWASGGTTTRSLATMTLIYQSYLEDSRFPYCVTSYAVHGWSYGEGTARSVDAYMDGAGYGTTSVDLLQHDYELRFTGEYDDAVTVGGVTYHPIKEGTGSLAILYGARLYDIKDHPDANNPGDGSAFFVRIPFEVWDMEAEGGPKQVMIMVYDRMQNVAAGGDFYAFNPIDRVYCDFCLEDYATVTAGDANDFLHSDLMTWNTVWWKCEWEQGDVLYFTYDNPIQFGSDEWTFSTVAPTTGDEDLAKEAVKKINVYPNPYYANNDLGTTRFDDYVTFTHLPEKATVRIFSISGIQVRVLKKNDASQFLKWDLQNEAGLPVGSGMYIVHVDLPDLGKEKVLKMVVVQKEQILEYY